MNIAIPLDVGRARTRVHGGAFFEAIGEEFETLAKKDSVIDAGVLDAWFDPAPSVVQTLAEYLSFAIRTSPPATAPGMRRTIARTRGVDEASILPGAGSSALIHAGLRPWIAGRDVSPVRAGASAAGRVLILDPMSGEYAHVLEQVIAAPVDRLPLRRERSYDVDLEELAARVARGYAGVVLVNPNSPTGRRIGREDLQDAIAAAPKTTRWWIDETYIDYANADDSLEAFAASSTNLIVCKSMSKAYSLSGVRAAYLCGPPSIIRALLPFCPAGSLSLPAQIAACEALKAAGYYRARWAETGALRRELADGLAGLGFQVVPACANFLLCRLPAKMPAAPILVKELGERGMFVRDVAGMGVSLDARAVRIAVKDRDTNLAMLEILRARLTETSHPKFSLSSPVLHDF
jgi:histidinol-phosphate/aromatic aminotransferase/cobyric acid decarboxylase-like protein